MLPKAAGWGAHVLGERVPLQGPRWDGHGDMDGVDVHPAGVRHAGGDLSKPQAHAGDVAVARQPRARDVCRYIARRKCNLLVTCQVRYVMR